MEVYRITLAKWADQLVGSGRAARWNSADRIAIYTASSRALACLENVVHRSGRGLQEAFRTIVVGIPDTVSIAEISFESLPQHWTEFAHYTDCQQLGDE